MLIPNESRATMMAYRQGRSLNDFLDEIWVRRSHEHPSKDKAEGKWPMTYGAQDAAPTLAELPKPKLRSVAR